MRYIYPAALVAAFLLVAVAAWTTGSSATYTKVPTIVAATQISQPAKTPTVTTPTKTTTPGTYRLDQVQIHNSQVSCWTTISGGVYDLTPFISQHPGGEAAILSLCGTDGTSAFLAQHSGNRRAISELATLKIGTLAQ